MVIRLLFVPSNIVLYIICKLHFLYYCIIVVYYYELLLFQQQPTKALNINCW